MHQNTSSETLRVGAELLRHGADVISISKHFFNTKPVNQLKLWGRVLSRASQDKNGVVTSAITQADLKEFEANKDMISGAIEFLKYIPGIQYARILCDEEEGKVKGSLRTIREDVDVSSIAAQFGGGGHIKAAGFSIPGQLQREMGWKVVGGGAGERAF